VKGLTVNFKLGRRWFSAVDDVDFTIYEGETFALVGESGSGKTTIGRAIMGTCHTNGGGIYYRGDQINRRLPREQLKKYRQEVQMIFQDPMSSLNERAKIDYIISEGLYNFKLFSSEEDRLRQVYAAMESVGLMPEYSSRFPHEFSGGQRQRIGIARSLVINPKLIIADEPISSLDVSIRAQILNLLNNLKKEKKLTYLFIAHDLSVVRYFSDRIAVMYKGRIVELAGSDELFNYTLHPYTRSLLDSSPVPDPDVERDKVIVPYDPNQHDYRNYKPGWNEIRPGHFIWANEPELANYNALLRQM